MAKLATVLEVVGKGTAAGLAGTAAMTVLQMLEMKTQGRGPSTTPAEAVERVLPVHFQGQQQKVRVSNVVHWVYGTAWGGAFGLLRALGLGQRTATLTQLGLVWGFELTALPKLGVSSPPTQWGKKAVATDFGHHALYAVTTGLAFHALTRGRRGAEREPLGAPRRWRAALQGRASSARTVS